MLRTCLAVFTAMTVICVPVASSSPTLISDWTFETASFDRNLRAVTCSGTSLYLADQFNHCLVAVPGDPRRAEDWGQVGNQAGNFNYPAAVTLGPLGRTSETAGRLYIADMFNDRIQIMDRTGGVVGMFGGTGTAPGLFRCARGVAVDHSGNIYVADALNYRVQKFTVDGTYLQHWGSMGSGPGQFGRGWEPEDPPRDHEHWRRAAIEVIPILGGPGDLALGPDQDLFVLDPVNARVQVFTSDGGFLRTWGGPGQGPGRFDRPQGIAVDASGIVYVADTGNARIQMFTSNGSYLGEWDDFRRLDQNRPPDDHYKRPLSRDGYWDHFGNPVAVDVDPAQRIAVVDEETSRVTRFRFQVANRSLWVDFVPEDGANRFNPDSDKMLTVVVAGDADFNVDLLAPRSIRLPNGARPVAMEQKDVLRPWDRSLIRMPYPDGYKDLLLHFAAEDVVANVGTPDGAVTLDILAETTGGTPMWGADHLAVATIPGHTEDVERYLFEVPATARVSIQVFDVQGRLIEDLGSEVRSPGTYELPLKNESYPNGLYFYRVHNGVRAQTFKVRILR